MYHLRRRSTGRNVLFGMGSRLASRMTSLLPRPYGTGTRNNAAKREYVLKHIRDIEYRTLACADRDDALDAERRLKARFDDWLYAT